MSQSRSLVDSRSVGATLSWVLIAVFAASAAVGLLAGDLPGALYAVAVVAAALVPPALARDGTVLVDWRVLAIAAVPVAARRIGPLGEATAYASVAALALLVAVEVDAFSTAEMPPWFAVLFVVLTTLTAAALWGVVQYFSDALLGTSFLADRTELMRDLLAATLVGVGAGVGFELFFREYDATDDADGTVDR